MIFSCYQYFPHVGHVEMPKTTGGATNFYNVEIFLSLQLRVQKMSSVYQENRMYPFIILCHTLLQFTMHVFEKETVRIKSKNLHV